MVFNVALQIMRTREDAEDVVQESFKLAFIHLKTFNGTSRFHYIRRELLQAYLSPLDVEDQNLNPEPLCSQKEHHGMLRKAVNRLSPGTGRVVELRDLDERSLEETSRNGNFRCCGKVAAISWPTKIAQPAGR